MPQISVLKMEELVPPPLKKKKSVTNFEVFHPDVLQHTNKYDMSVNNTTYIVYIHTMVYM